MRPLVPLLALACRAERAQRSAVERVDLSDQVPIERIRPSCDGNQPCETWVISTPADGRGDNMPRFAAPLSQSATAWLYGWIRLRVEGLRARIGRQRTVSGRVFAPKSVSSVPTPCGGRLWMGA